jgi:hypothetical protein
MIDENILGVTLRNGYALYYNNNFDRLRSETIKETLIDARWKYSEEDNTIVLKKKDIILELSSTGVRAYIGKMWESHRKYWRVEINLTNYEDVEIDRDAGTLEFLGESSKTQTGRCVVAAIYYK